LLVRVALALTLVAVLALALFFYGRQAGTIIRCRG